jgi:hypothetical protein
MKELKRVLFAIAITLLAAMPLPANAGDQPANAPDPAVATIAPGTVITMANWQQYKDFMPDGMIGLFAGKYFWKMPDAVHMEVGPTVLHPLPKSYLDATEKYAQQVQLRELPTGGLTLDNYHGGIPFPNPADPHKGWKALANLWYRYIPHLAVDTFGSGCSIDGSGAANCQTYVGVKRQLSYNTDANAPPEAPGPKARYFTEWFMTLEPEQQKYTAYLTVNFADPAKPEEAYVFLPSLRRYQPVSNAARCSQSAGMDPTYEDFHNGFDSNLTELTVDYLSQRKILAMVDAKPPAGAFPDGVLMPLGWPTPKWGTWQLRDVDVLSVKKIPAKAKGYCYSNRVIYSDRHFAYPLWEELYDADGKLWKIFGIFPELIDVPGAGPVNTAALDIEVYWDLKNNHASFASEPYMDHPAYTNEQAPKEYNDDARYTTAAGLNLIMR